MGKLKTFTKIGAKNNLGEVVIPAIYGDIDCVDNYLVSNKDNKIISLSEPIYLAYQHPYYHLYNEKGKIECPFKIKYYCVEKNLLVGLMDENGYWHVISVDITINEVNILLDNLKNIESANFNHVVCRREDSKQFVYSLEKKAKIMEPVLCDEINLFAEGIHIKKDTVGEIYDYSGSLKLTGNWELSTINGVEINSHELILAKNNYPLLGLYSFTGECILPTQYNDINVTKHYYNQKEFICLDTSSSTSAYSRVLFHLDSNLKINAIYLDYTSVDFFDCGRVGLFNTESKSTLVALLEEDDKFICKEILTADKIEPLYVGSCRHFKVWNKNRCGVCNLKGEFIIPIKYQTISVNEWHDKVSAYPLLGYPHRYDI